MGGGVLVTRHSFRVCSLYSLHLELNFSSWTQTHGHLSHYADPQAASQGQLTCANEGEVLFSHFVHLKGQPPSHRPTSYHEGHRYLEINRCFLPCVISSASCTTCEAATNKEKRGHNKLHNKVKFHDQHAATHWGTLKKSWLLTFLRTLWLQGFKLKQLNRTQPPLIIRLFLWWHDSVPKPILETLNHPWYISKQNLIRLDAKAKRKRKNPESHILFSYLQKTINIC